MDTKQETGASELVASCKEYGRFYKYMPEAKSPERPMFKKYGQIVSEAEMRERIESRRIKEKREEEGKRRCGGINLPEKKLYTIDKTIRKKLLEKPPEVNYSNLIEPLVNEKYNVAGLGPGPDEVEDSSENTGKVEETKGMEPSGEDPSQRVFQKSNDIITDAKEEREATGKRITFEEWVYRKETEAQYWKLLLEAEREEQQKEEEQKQQEKERRAEERARAVADWQKRKDEELQLKRMMEQQRQEQELLEKQKKKDKGECCYQNWLEESVMKMQQEKEKQLLERQQKQAIEEEDKRRKELRKERAEKSYQEWLRHKNEELKIKEMIKREEEKELQKSIRPFNKSDYDVKKIVREELGLRPKKKRGKKRKGTGKRKAVLKQFEENVEEIKAEDDNIMEKIRQPEVRSKPKSSDQIAKERSPIINPIIEEKGKEQSKSSDMGSAENVKNRIEELKNEEEKVEAKVKKAISQKKRKGKKHEPPAEQIFEEISSIQRSSQQVIEGDADANGEDYDESGLLNIDQNNRPSPEMMGLKGEKAVRAVLQRISRTQAELAKIHKFG